MALNTFTCNCLTPLHFKGLKLKLKLTAFHTLFWRLNLWNTPSVNLLKYITLILRKTVLTYLLTYLLTALHGRWLEYFCLSVLYALS